MAWCRQATSHYLSQCWPRSLLPFEVTRPQWVKKGYMKDICHRSLNMYNFTKAFWAHNPNFTKIHIALPVIIIIRSGHNFAHVTTAEQLWYVQNCRLIGSLKSYIGYEWKIYQHMPVASALEILQSCTNPYIFRYSIIYWYSDTLILELRHSTHTTNRH